MQKYPHISLSASILIILIVPFVLKLKNPRLEIYPAVIFPAGASVVNVEENYLKTSSLELFGYNEKLTPIETKVFLNRIPNYYLQTIAEGNFGLEAYRKEFKLYKPPITFSIENNHSPEALKETQEWLKSRLREQDLIDSVFVMRVNRLKFDLKSKQLKSKQLVREKVFELN